MPHLERTYPMKKFLLLIVALVIGLVSGGLLPCAAQAENWWESKQAGSTTDQIAVNDGGQNDVVASASRTNWEDGYVEVMAGATADTAETVNMAHAFSVASKTARHLAYEKLAETVNGLNLYSDATYDRELMVDANLRTVMRAMIRNARVVDEKQSQFADGSIWVEVTLGMKMFGEDGLIQPSIDWQQRQPVSTQPAPAPVPVKPAPAGDVTYTGLIIDAGGLGASPAMLPKLKTEGGKVIYGTGEIDKDYVMRFGIMGYQNDLEAARKIDRVGGNPLVVKAAGVSGKNRTDFVLSIADAERVLKASAATNFLKECRVVAVLN